MTTEQQTTAAQRLFLRFLQTREAQMRAAYKRTFETEDGREVLEDLIQFAGIGREAFVPGQGDLRDHILGMQRVVLRITGFLDMSDRELLRLSHLTGENTDGKEG